MTEQTPETEPSLSVNVASHTPGVTPVAFLCVVECLDADGEKVYRVVATDGITDKRRAVLASALGEACG